MGLKEAVLGAAASALILSAASKPRPEMSAKAEYALEDIAAGRLSYSRNCGWIDWGHAGGDGPAALVRHVLAERPTPLSAEDEAIVKEYMTRRGVSRKSHFPIVYFQEMRKPSLKLAAGVRSVYLVKKGLPRKTREGIAWRIFKEVSTQYERRQGELPFSLVPKTAASSFGMGDLTGDKISFYRALRGYSDSFIERTCKPYSPEQSMKYVGPRPKPQDRWRDIPGIPSVPKIPRGVVKTVIQDETFYGDYR